VAPSLESVPSTPTASFQSNVIHVGTFSKILAPGLRLGWAVAPEDVVDKLIQAKQAADLHTGTLTQHIAWELVRGGFLDRQILLLRHAYRERRDAMLAALEKYFPNTATWTRPDGGMFLLSNECRRISFGITWTSGFRGGEWNP
jgi:2-aminoadipate transaminase